MHRPQPRAIAVTLAAALLATATGCGGGGAEDGSGGRTSSGGSAEPAAEAPEGGAAAGAELGAEEVEAAIAVYEAGACWTCHGRPHKDQPGLAGPPLSGLTQHWSAEDLADFIDDPEAWVAKDDRLAVKKSEFTVPMMPPMRPISIEDRTLLARWLLTLE